MSTPYALLIIKPLTIGRGEGPEILSKILDECPVALKRFRQWVICDTTLKALTQDTGPEECDKTDLEYAVEQIHCVRQAASWICIFTHTDRVSDPIQVLMDYCGPASRQGWLHTDLRYQMSHTTHASDTVVHIAKPERRNYEANMLFMTFDEAQL